jgi:hypothetical protein
MGPAQGGFEMATGHFAMCGLVKANCNVPHSPFLPASKKMGLN